jgi:hypothetical protein
VLIQVFLPVLILVRWGRGIVEGSIVLALMVLSHVITDFVVQTDAMAKAKQYNSAAMGKHIWYYFLTNMVVMSPYLSFANNLWLIIVLLTLAHWIIDAKKADYEKVNKKKGLEAFLLDQFMHLGLIGLSYPFIKDVQLNFFGNSVSALLVTHYPVFELLTKQAVFIDILIITGYIFNFKGATVMIQKVLDKYLHLKDKHNKQGSQKELIKQVLQTYEFQRNHPDQENATIENAINERYHSRDLSQDERSAARTSEDKQKAGEAIGILERIIILTLVLQKNYAVIGLVIAGKTIARYKKLEEKDFAEYYLIGTFTSLIAALFVGEIIALLKFG